MNYKYFYLIFILLIVLFLGINKKYFKEYFSQPNLEETLKKLGYKKHEVNKLKEKIYTGNIDENITLELIKKGREKLSDNEVFSILL
jgi:hypothetical protein